MTPTEQRLASLRLADEVRSERARIRRALWAGEISFADLDLDAPHLQGMAVFDLLSLLPVGSHHRTPRRPAPHATALDRARRLLDEFGTSHSVTFGALSDTRKAALVELVEPQETRWRVAA